MSLPTAAERLLQSLGVSQPSEIDLEAIAWLCGAEVRYAPLQSCEARIIGFGSRAIITVDDRRGAARTRFSIGHELGHWHYHRGRSSVCRAEEIGGAPQATSTMVLHPERVADAYGADLLLPEYLFRPAALKLKRASFKAIDQLAEDFQSSRTAAALRMVDFGPEPAMLICHGPAGRKWFRRGKDIPDKWFPRQDVDAESNAIEVLHGGQEKPHPLLIGADAWFDRRDAEQHELYEQTVRAGSGDILTLLTFKGPGLFG